MDSSESESMQSSNGGNEKDFDFSRFATLPSSPYPINLHHVESLLSKSQKPDQIQTPPMKTGKKRTRASRRTPTMVLTTNTSNFRAMVQEYTGIPQFSKAAKVEAFAGPPMMKAGPVSSFHLQPSSAPVIPSQAKFFAPYNSTTMAATLGAGNLHKQDPQHLRQFGGFQGGQFEEFVGSTSQQTARLSGNDSVYHGCPYGSYNGEMVNGAKGSLNGDDSSAFMFHDDKRGGDSLMEAWICSSDI